MILNGTKDLRVIKTITGIKSAFRELICEKDYEKITVKELCDRAKINKKTFYHYYKTLDKLLLEIQMEVSEVFLERIKEYHLPDELDKVTREFFLYSSEQDAAYEKITCSGSYYKIRNIMLARVNDARWSKSDKFVNLNEFENKILLEFVNNTALSVYKRWIESGKTIPLEEVIQMANQLQLGGVNAFFSAKKKIK